MTKRLLFCLAHPDDESFGSGPFIAKSVADGVEVSLICATNGDVGTVSPEKLGSYKSVSELRSAELDCAAQVLGFKDVIRFGYRDSGMMNSPDNKHPAALWQADEQVLRDQIIEVIERLRPQVLVTFNKFGGYGHPDHIKIQRATVAAFNKMQGTPDAPQKLYYTAFPTAILRMGVMMMRLSGRDPRRMGTNKDLDYMAVLESVEPIHARVDVNAYYDIGQQAAACHGSQSSPRNTFPFARYWMRRAAGTAGFTRVEPPPQVGQPVERDLFEGVKDV
ncbi:MAG: PIG-L family deacetylase [Anaerolineae bacterium]|nr:PIG-L family deacetylase [Anaerolineae bacterium]